MEVLQAGLLSTLQDLGRPGYAHLGVSAAGAADPVSMRLANRLVGNRDHSAVIECTLQGPKLRVTADCIISVCGAPFDCSIPLCSGVRVSAGSVLEIGGCRSGARCYVAVGGGFEAPLIMGSASVHLLSGFGGPLRRGDVLRTRASDRQVAPGRRATPPEFRTRLRVTVGPDADRFPVRAVFELLDREWVVSDHSNRQGIRLSGDPLAIEGLGSRPSEGVALGAIQVPPGGAPVILFVDSQTTGGYPVIANVISADLCSVGQLRPRDRVSLEVVSLEAARSLLLEQEMWILNVG